MATHYLGSTTANTSGYNETQTYNEIENTAHFTTPSAGYITKIAAYFGSTGGGAMSARTLLFDSNHNIMVESAQATVYGEGWQVLSPASPYWVPNGSWLSVGWWVQSGISQKFAVNYQNGQWVGGSVGSTPTGAGGFTAPSGNYAQGAPNVYLVWIDPASISSATGQNSSKAGEQISIYGAGFTGGVVSSVTFNGIPSPSVTVVNDGQINAIIPSGDASGSLVVNTDHGSPSITWTQGPPSIQTLSPSSAVAGATVTVNGKHFTDGTVTGVHFNGIAAASYTVVSNTQITAVVPNGYTTGNLEVTMDFGGVADIAFTEGPPIISSVSPTNAGVGQNVTIAGSGFTDGSVSSVTFTPAGQSPITSTYTVNSNTQITATVPTGAAGNDVVTVNSNHGAAEGNVTVTGAWVADGTNTPQSSTVYAHDGSAPQTCTIYSYDGNTWQQTA